MKIIAIIPARYASSRFPGKPLVQIAGKPMIEWVYERVRKTAGLSAVYVATDDIRIYDCVQSFGGKVLMTSSNHSCGTDRIAECVTQLDVDDQDVILNIQGDEPLIRAELVEDLISVFKDPNVYMGTLKQLLDDDAKVDNPNIVKVITDLKGDAIYFSRCPIPYERNKQCGAHYKHIGVYGYKKWFLLKYCKMEKTTLEKMESLEQLRAIENGYKIRVKETQWKTIGVDTPEQVDLVEKELKGIEV